MTKYHLIKIGIYICLIQSLLLLFCFLFSIDYYHKQKVIATTHPFFIKREQVISRVGCRNGVDICILYNNKKYYVEISHNQEPNIKSTPLYYDVAKDQIFTNSETIYGLIFPWITFVLSFFSWLAVRQKKYIWAVDCKGKRPQEMS